LKGEARDWYHSLNHFDGLDWEYLKKALYVKYYSPFKAYCDRSHIYIFGLILKKVLIKIGTIEGTSS
jgi:hypothetical protein